MLGYGASKDAGSATSDSRYATCILITIATREYQHATASHGFESMHCVE